MNSFLIITKMVALASEKVNRNSVTKVVHWVSKNCSFTVHLSSSVNLNASPLSARVLYDTDAGHKEVDTVTKSPIEYVAHVDESGFNAAVEVRLKVLSSQLEGSYFLVAFTAFDPASGKTLEAISQPIKCVSKKLQIRRLLAKQDNVNPTEVAQVAPKRTPSDSVAEALLRIEEQQREQSRLIQELMEQQKGNNKRARSEELTQSEPNSPEVAFKKFVAALKKLPTDERPSKIRKMIANLDSEEQAQLLDLNSFLSADKNTIGSLETSPFLSSYADDSQVHSTACNSGSCPYKKELEKLNNFYYEFLADPNQPQNISNPDPSGSSYFYSSD